MKHSFPHLLSLIAFTTLASSSAVAQKPTQGAIHTSAGVAYGSAALSCQDCGSDRESSPAIFVRVGKAITPSLVLNAQVMRWSKSSTEEGVTADWSVWVPSAVAQWYPQLNGGLYLSGGLGLVLTKLKFTEDILSIDGSAKHIGLQAGLGYDIPMSPQLNITPYAEFLYASGANLKLGNSGTGFNVSANLVQVGVALSWRNK